MTDITAHIIIRNEDRFAWYTVVSVLPYVNRMLIFDTGSDDATRNIIHSFNDPKIVFEEKGAADPKRIVLLRQEQLDRTKTEWVWIVDGDEVYPKNTAESIIRTITETKQQIGIIVHRYDLLGDVYHRQDERVGSYDQFGKRGHYVLRLINKKRVPGLSVKRDYPNEYFADKNGKSIKEKGKKYFSFVEERIFHASYLPRSTKGANLTSVVNRNKWKIETGIPIKKDELPEVFFESRPANIPDITQPRGLQYEALARIITPIKQMKRILLGYS